MGKYASREAAPAALEPEPLRAEAVQPHHRCCTCDRVLAWCGLARRRRVDDLVALDDGAAMERSLLWSDAGDGPRADDYLGFVPEHVVGLMEDSTERLELPKPAEDRYDY